MAVFVCVLLVEAGYTGFDHLISSVAFVSLDVSPVLAQGLMRWNGLMQAFYTFSPLVLEADWPIRFCFLIGRSGFAPSP